MLLNIDARELGTILEALRYIQRDMEAEGTSWEHGDIATDGGTVEALSVTEIDDLCARINTPGQVTLGIVMDGGLLQDVISNDPAALSGLRVISIDYDVDGADEDRVSMVPQSDGSEAPAYVHTLDIDPAGIDLAATHSTAD